MQADRATSYNNRQRFGDSPGLRGDPYVRMCACRGRECLAARAGRVSLSPADEVAERFVAIDLGDNFNRVVNVYAWLDSQVDLLDANPDCAGNYWFAEPIIGIVTPQTCIN